MDDTGGTRHGRGGGGGGAGWVGRNRALQPTISELFWPRQSGRQVILNDQPATFTLAVFHTTFTLNLSPCYTLLHPCLHGFEL